MWSDTLLGAEQRHLLSVVAWGVASLLVGGTLLIVNRRQPQRSPLLTHFGLQMSAWGAAAGFSAGIRWPMLGNRDVTGATHLDQMVWFASGLEIGVALMGAAIAGTSWWAGRRLAGVGAGLAIAAQGLALLVLNLQLVVQITR